MTKKEYEAVILLLILEIIIILGTLWAILELLIL